MQFNVSIKDHRRLRPFLNRYRNTGNRDWELRNEIISYDKEGSELLSVDGSVNISYLALLKHIAIGGNGYSRRILRDFNLDVIVGKESYNFNNHHKTTRSLVYKLRKKLKIIGIFLEFFDFFSFSHTTNFIPRGFFLDKTEKKYMSYRIGQGLASYLASEIDNIFFSLPYDEIWENLSGAVKNQIQEFRREGNIRAGSSPDLIGFFIGEDSEIASIAIEAKGRVIKGNHNEIQSWKDQTRASGLGVEYGVVVVTYNLYKQNTTPRCLYKDPETLPGYNLKKKDYGKLLNTYYQPFRDLIKHFGFALLEKNIQGVRYYVLNLGNILSKTPCLYKLLECLNYYHHLHYNCFSFMIHHNFYLRKDFLDIDWETEKDFSIFKKHHKIQEPNLYIDNDGIGFGIED